MPPARRIESAEIHAALEGMADVIAGDHRETGKLGILGIADGGIALSRRLAQLAGERLGRELPIGVIDISFQRDDISTNPIPKASNPTSIPFDIEGATVILADDVLSTGRSLRAALNEIFDQGRPARVQAAALFDRGGRILPFDADYRGFRESIPSELVVDVRLNEKNPEHDEIRVAEAANQR